MRQEQRSIAQREDPRVTRTRKLLQDAFVGLMGDRGFDAITVHDITAAAGVNHATFYRHYRDKYHLADAIFAEALDTMFRAFGPQRPISEIEKTESAEVLKSWGILFRHVADNDRLYRTLFSSRGGAEFTRRIRERLVSVVKKRMETRIGAGTPRGARRLTAKERSSDIPYALAANLMIGTMQWWLEEGGKHDLDQVILWTRRILHNGFADFLT